ncbi:MAG TPA: phage holin family protein [Clostridia bacterium]|nr:phage holin family protein [Clostridia bacterium]
MDFEAYIKPELLILIPVLYVMGMLLKKLPKIPDWIIPFGLLGVSLMLCIAMIGWSVQAIIQAVFVAAATVFGNQLIKQGTERDPGGSDDDLSDTEDQGSGTSTPTLRKGSTGIAVQLMQQELNECMFRCGAVDGIFGPATLAAVKAFQKANKLVVDGICGPKTWAKLLSKDRVKNPNPDPAVYYSQKDARWGSQMYSSTGNKTQTIASSGCGPVSMAMVVSTLVKKVLPPELCTFAVKNGHRTQNNGTAWSFFPDAAEKYGLRCNQTYDTDTVVAALKTGKLVIANMGKGYWTNGGHYIVLQKADDKDIYANDPASVNRTKASIASFAKERKTYFIFSKDEAS